MKNSNLIIPDYTEEIVGFMLQSMLTIVRFPRAPFALVPLSKKDEVIYGTDALIESINPIYIQFKRTFGYPDFSRSKLIKDRVNLKANISPRILFFDLRNKQPNHKDYQHNVLFDLKTKLNSTGKGTAFYTAPLFLNRSAYHLAVHLSSILNWRPWHWFMDEPFYRDIQNIVTSSGTIRFQNIPILREHIVIPPHIKVTTHKHKYSFLERGKEICFHEPTRIENGKTLGDTVYNYLNFREGLPTTEMTNLLESNNLLGNLQDGLFDETEAFSQESIIDKWINFGYKLRSEYEIYQFMLMKLKV